MLERLRERAAEWRYRASEWLRRLRAGKSLEDEWQELKDEVEFGAPLPGLNEYSRRELRAYQPRLTAFIDILGFRSLVGRMKEEEETRHQLLKALRSLALKRTRESDYSSVITDQRVSCFSDCIVISYPFYGHEDLEYLIVDVAVITREMARLGLAVRGSIVLAELHQTPGIIVGEALVEAYDLEKKHADVPRVILAPDVLRTGVGLGRDTSDELLWEWIEAGRTDADAEGYEYHGFWDDILKDEDGYYFVDHLATKREYADWPEEDLQEHRDYLGLVRTLIEDNLGQLKVADLPPGEREKRWKKWLWYSRYFDMAAQKCGLAAPLLVDESEHK